MIILDRHIKLTPEEAITLARRLLESAELVIEDRKTLAGAYADRTLVGTNHDGTQPQVIRFRIGRIPMKITL